MWGDALRWWKYGLPESSHCWCSHPSRALADPSITAVGEKSFKIGASQPHLRLHSEAQPGSEAAMAAELSFSQGKRSHTQPGCASGHSDGAPAMIPCGPEGQRVSVRDSQGSSLEQTSAQSKTRCPVGVSKDQDRGGKTPSWQPGAHQDTERRLRANHRIASGPQQSPYHAGDSGLAPLGEVRKDPRTMLSDLPPRSAVPRRARCLAATVPECVCTDGALQGERERAGLRAGASQSALHSDTRGRAR